MGEAIVFLTGRQRASITTQGRNQQGRRAAACQGGDWGDGGGTKHKGRWEQGRSNQHEHTSLSFVAAAQHHQRRPSLRRPLTRNCSYQCLTELTNFMIKGKNLGCENRARIDISCSQMLKFLIRLLNTI